MGDGNTSSGDDDLSMEGVADWIKSLFKRNQSKQERTGKSNEDISIYLDAFERNRNLSLKDLVKIFQDEGESARIRSNRPATKREIDEMWDGIYALYPDLPKMKRPRSRSLDSLLSITNGLEFPAKRGSVYPYEKILSCKEIVDLLKHMIEQVSHPAIRHKHPDGWPPDIIPFASDGEGGVLAINMRASENDHTEEIAEYEQGPGYGHPQAKSLKDWLAIQTTIIIGGDKGSIMKASTALREISVEGSTSLESASTETLDAAGYESRLVLANAIELGLRTMDRALGNHAASFFEGTEMTRAYRARLLAGKIKKHIMEGHVYGGEK